MFNASIINLESGVQAIGRSVNYKNLNDGLTAIQKLAEELTGKPLDQLAEQPPLDQLAEQLAMEAAKASQTGDFSTGRRIGAGFGNLALGLGSFTMGDWKGGAIVAGGYAAAAGLILWDIFGLTYEDNLAGIPGSIGIGVAAATAVFGFIRPFFFHRTNPAVVFGNRPLSPLEGFDIGLVPAAGDTLAVRFSYGLHF
jgi:hypothetical protein